MEAFLGRSTWDLGALLKANDISIPVQQHLVRVYAALAATILVAGVGVALDAMLDLAGLTSTFGSLGLIIYLFFVDKQLVAKRMGVLLTIAACMGINIGPLVSVALDVDASIVITAFLATAVIFLCFTGSALIEKRRTYMYLISVISSATLVMSMISLVNLFTRSIALYNAHLYMGLLVFCGYVLFDTQMIIEKASLGDLDFIGHALELFLDFINIFVRLLVILLRNAEKKEKKRESRR
ncbi:bax inhibitor-like protein [Achlya hypogyna]|uniref:Bax inhibitor-like protein n=1 Tax=Achlya hypogyna TaxID=1202772 RepID=A0A1V9ZSC7_ACHHY|nr:bax inhibitor-like protein [Achlya hypogyna]